MTRVISWPKVLASVLLLLALLGASLSGRHLPPLGGSPGAAAVPAVYANGDSCDDYPPPPFLNCPPPTPTPTPPLG
jgi:hypothetical protein